MEEKCRKRGRERQDEKWAFALIKVEHISGAQRRFTAKIKRSQIREFVHKRLEKLRRLRRGVSVCREGRVSVFF